MTGLPGRARPTAVPAARTRPDRRCRSRPTRTTRWPGSGRAGAISCGRPCARCTRRPAIRTSSGSDRQGRRHAAVGGDAGAAARRAGVRRQRQADGGLGGELRRGRRRHGRLRAGHGVRPDLAAARRRAGAARRRRSRRRSCAARWTGWASNRSSSSATSTRTPPTGSCAPSSPRRTARPSTGSPNRSTTTRSRRSPPDAGSTAARVRELADTGPRTAAEARDGRAGRRLGYRDEVYAALRSRVGTRRRAAVRRPMAPAPAPRLPARRAKGHVALVEVRGAIAPGR